ncbi:PIN domain-containing protein [Ruegeria sp. WL0004]|uniref:PIN domain-containing protein n=1 Tax=Ruegeria marisflavi TaxID=2984152 RepID=A0ABT2WLW9_9RHOB|nr:PIN domain-containing protein [Ruegeria sp. WL0004]MCU9836899.1 PIN domain-containing protein [Ruegeria sp. WL0004]
MKAVLDTCVIYPTVMREMLLGAARLGHFTPLWSARILEEWARAAVKLGPAGEAQARAEITLTRATWPRAEVPQAPGVEARLWLPDPADIHVLATAIAGSADAIVTLNRSDFPRNILAEEGLDRIDPDALLLQFFNDGPEGFARMAAKVLDEANRLSGKTWTLRSLMKKARLPRLGKALEHYRSE